MSRQAQCVKESAQITEQESLQLTRNLLRIAIFNISYIRGLFPEKYFDDKYVPALEMKIKKLMPLDSESRRLIDWMEKGVYDALQKKYLKRLVFSLCDGDGDTLIEEYTFSFRYGDTGEEFEVNLSKNCVGKKSNKALVTSKNDITPAQMKSSACKMVRTLVQLMRTLDGVPEERTILMKLHYFEEKTPKDYEPPFFRAYLEENAQLWQKAPLKMAVGEVNSKHYAIALKVHSTLDPCEDEDCVNENQSMLSRSTSCGSDSMSKDSKNDEVDGPKHGHEREFPVQPDQAKITSCPEVMEVDACQESEKTEDGEYESQSFEAVKDWVLSRMTKEIDAADVMSSFPQLSLALVNDIMKRLVDSGVLDVGDRDLYKIVSLKNNQEITENDSKLLKQDIEDQLFQRALQHIFQMEYVTIAGVQSKFGGEISFTVAKKMLDRMAEEGYIKQTASNRRMGRKVLKKLPLCHLESHLEEMVEGLGSINLQKHCQDDASNLVPPKSGANTSTMGVNKSYGSDDTRSLVNQKPDEFSAFQDKLNSQNDSAYMTSLGMNATPAGSCTSPGRKVELLQQGRSLSMDTERDDNQKIRKASVVEEPIHQNAKRLKTEE